MVKNTVKLTSMIAAIYLFAGYQELSAPSGIRAPAKSA